MFEPEANLKTLDNLLEIIRKSIAKLDNPDYDDDLKGTPVFKRE
jgi:hypothetical protein